MPQSQAIASRRRGQPVLVLTGGGSGGHITPLLSLARALKKADPECRIVYIGHKGDRFDRLEEHYHDFDDVAFITAGKFRRYHGQRLLAQMLDIKTFLLNVRDFFRVFGSTVAAHRILRKVKPAVVLSKGSFVAVPVGIAARIRGIPIVTHDSDAVPGLANRIVGRWAKIHATALPAAFYTYPKGTVSHVGVPLDENIRPVTIPRQKNFKHELGLPADALLLLVSGGGLGSKNINDKMLAIAPKLLSESPNLHIIHLSGQKNEEQVREVMAKALSADDKKRVKVIGFSGDFYKMVGAADVIVGRAGATSLAEFAAAGKACILIPSPFLTGGHQLKNADELKKSGSVEIVDNDAPPGDLYTKLSELIKDKKYRESLAKKMAATAKTDAADKLAEILLGVAKRSEDG